MNKERTKSIVPAGIFTSNSVKSLRVYFDQTRVDDCWNSKKTNQNGLVRFSSLLLSLNNVCFTTGLLGNKLETGVAVATWLPCYFKHVCSTIHGRLWHSVTSVISSHSVDNVSVIKVIFEHLNIYIFLLNFFSPQENNIGKNLKY